MITLMVMGVIVVVVVTWLYIQHIKDIYFAYGQCLMADEVFVHFNKGSDPVVSYKLGRRTTAYVGYVGKSIYKLCLKKGLPMTVEEW